MESQDANEEETVKEETGKEEAVNRRSVGTALASRRLRFREALQDIAGRATSNDLVRWMLIPASVVVIVGFNFMIWGWVGAAGTFRQIEQIPYLISGGLIGLALVVLGGLMLAATFFVVVMRKFQEEAEADAREQIETLTARLVELETTLAITDRNGTGPTGSPSTGTPAKRSKKKPVKRAKPRAKRPSASPNG